MEAAAVAPNRYTSTSLEAAAELEGARFNGSKMAERAEQAGDHALRLGRPLRLLITSPPGSGKSTYAERIAKDYGVVHVNAGALLREKAKNDPDLAAVINRGELVAPAVVVAVIKERLAQSDVQSKGYILDGFPRRISGVPVLRVTVRSPDIDANYARLKTKLDALPLGKASVPRWKTGFLGAIERILPSGPMGERKLAFLLFGWNFLIIASYYIISPVRGAFLMHSFGPTMLPWVYMASAAVTGAAVWIYSRFSRLPRFKLIGGSMVFLALNLVGWWAIGLTASQIGWVGFAFYIWGDVFSIMAVTLFWTYANDRFGPEAAKRTFGFLAAAGPLGAIAGSLLTTTLVSVTGVLPLLLAAAGIFGVSLLFFGLAERNGYVKEGPAAAAPAEKVTGKETDVLKTIASSKFLIFLSGLVMLERLVPDFGNYIFNAAAFAAYPAKADLVAFIASFGLWQNVAALAASLFLTSTVLKKLGIGKTLMGAPLTNLIGFALFMISPILPVVVGFSGADGLQRYTWFKSAKEATYTAENKSVIYNVKAFIEMTLYRSARGLAGLALLLITGQAFLGLSTAAVALTGIPLAALWVYVSWRLGQEFDARQAQKVKTE